MRGMWISGEKRIQVDGIFKKKTKRELFHNQTTHSEEAILWLSLITSITVFRASENRPAARMRRNAEAGGGTDRARVAGGRSLAARERVVSARVRAVSAHRGWSGSDTS